MTDKGSVMFKIVPVKPGHFPAIARIEKECFSPGWSETALAEFFASPGAIGFVAAESGSTLGYITGRAIEGEGEIANLAVTADSRGHRIGTALVAAFCDALFSDSVDAVFLEVRETNTAARRLYEKAGFIQAGVRKNFYEHPRENGIIYKKERTGTNENTEF